MTEIATTCKAATKIYEEAPDTPVDVKAGAKVVMDKLCSGAEQDRIRKKVV